jgi:hypothetical protein
MSYDPTQQVPPPQGYPPQGGYPQQGYPQQQGYTQQGYPSPQPPAPQTYQQYSGGPAPTSAGFDFNAFWKKLGLNGQVGLISGVVLFISLLLPWFSVSASSALSSSSASANAFAVANHSNTGDVGTTGFVFTLVWLVILASIALIALPILTALGKLNARQGQMFTLITAGVALLIEIIYMISAFSVLSSSDKASFATLGVSVSVGPGFGFWIGLLATLAAGGVYLYFNYIKKPAMVGMPVGSYQQPYQQPGQYPGSQPYQQPGQYPGSQPYQPPTQYPGQYPGQQPPQYPGQ